MSLRESIADIIEAAGADTDKASKEICLFLENEIGLAGNGWFDNDEVMLALLDGEGC